jgi:hypothetical protein
MDAVHRAIDHAELHPEAGKAGREGEPGRACTHDQDVEQRSSLVFIPHCSNLA